MPNIKKFYPRIRSRHPSHSDLRKGLEKLPFRSVIRLGSTTIEPVVQGKEINSVEAVKISSNKLLMKKKFDEFEIPTANWFTYDSNNDIYIHSSGEEIGREEIHFPVVIKHIYGSRGTGNFLIKTGEEMESFFSGKDSSKYIIEKFYNYSREYRLHVSEDSCFYTCRKMLKQDTPADKRWFRNDSNSTWIIEENPMFDTPINWDEIVSSSIKALKAVGLDIGAIDVKVQASKNSDGEFRDKCEFIILETNSAPSFGTITLQKYKEELPKILKKKYL